jgi:SAM-dependent methyltransferase
MVGLVQISETVQELTQRGADRLYPRLSDPNYLILRNRRELFQRWLAGVPGHSLQVLDVGGRLQPYRALLEHRVRRYVAVDLRSTALVDIVGRAEALPLAAESFDLAFCTQVLEYVADPNAAVAELYRVLKLGGVLLLSVPAIFPRDSDEEYWRFQPAALRLLLAPFARIEIEPEGHSIAGIFRTVNVFLIGCARFMLIRKVLSYTVAPLLNLTARGLESVLAVRNDQFAANYSALAKK